jgi:DNA-binding winged helix-turn-helix (wHTH) protein/tetratricopeptide (TPR) repeat protein/TolB-like protein
VRDQVEPNRYRGPVELAAVADFSLGGLWVQPSVRRVSAGVREELIEPRVMQAFVALAEAAGAVVSRDVLIDRCWDGRIVGDDAINRCVAKVRRLAEIADPAAFSIETVSKVGYRLKPAPGLPHHDDPAQIETVPGVVQDAAPPAASRSRKMRLAAGLAVVLITAGGLAWAMLAPSAAPADRMTLGIESFTASGAPGAAGLAAKFTQAAIERLSQSEVLVVSTAAPATDTGASAPRYILSGTVRSEADAAKVSVQVIERPTGRLLFTNQTQQPAGIGQQAVYAATVRLTGGVEWRVRDAELARYHGKPRDALDMVLRASQDIDDWAPVHDPEALALGEQALALEPDNVAAQNLVATLLFLDFQISDAHRGDAEGRRALALNNIVLRERPFNLIHQHLNAALLLSLGDLHGAQSAAESALAEEPENPGMRATLSAALLQQGDVAGSIRALPDGEDSEDDFPAAQQFAQGRYQDALATMQRVAAQTPLQGPSSLFLAGLFAQFGRLDEAHATLAKALACLPPELDRVSSIRQVLFKLPDRSWEIFKADLRKAGMTD